MIIILLHLQISQLSFRIDINTLIFCYHWISRHEISVHLVITIDLRQHDFAKLPEVTKQFYIYTCIDRLVKRDYCQESVILYIRSVYFV